MHSQVVGLRVGSAVFGAMCVGHLSRLVMQAKVSVGTLVLPLWPSAVALIVLAVLCVWLWRLSSESSAAGSARR